MDPRRVLRNRPRMCGLWLLMPPHRWGKRCVSGEQGKKDFNAPLAAAVTFSSQQGPHGARGQQEKQKSSGAGKVAKEKAKEKRTSKIQDACGAQDFNDLKSVQEMFVPVAKKTILARSTPRSRQMFRFSPVPNCSSTPPSDTSLKSQEPRLPSSLTRVSDLSLKCLVPRGSTPLSKHGQVARFGRRAQEARIGHLCVLLRSELSLSTCRP